MKITALIKLSAAIEAATGLAALASPSFVVRLLLGAELSSGGVAIGRLASMALLALTIACWPGPQSHLPQITRSLFVYNLLAGLYLGFLGADHVFFSYLLWPASALHIVIAIFLAGLPCALSRKLRSLDVECLPADAEPNLRQAKAPPLPSPVGLSYLKIIFSSSI